MYGRNICSMNMRPLGPTERVRWTVNSLVSFCTHMLKKQTQDCQVLLEITLSNVPLGRATLFTDTQDLSLPPVHPHRLKCLDVSASSCAWTPPWQAGSGLPFPGTPRTQRLTLVRQWSAWNWVTEDIILIILHFLSMYHNGDTWKSQLANVTLL